MVIKMSFGPKILFISNEKPTMPWVLHVLQQHLQVVREYHPAQAFQCWIDESPDIVILDIEPLEPLALQPTSQLREQAVIQSECSTR